LPGGVAQRTRWRNNCHGSDRQEREAAIVTRMLLDPAQLPDDIALLKAMLIEENRRTSDLDAEIENLKLQIAKLRHARFGNSSERTSVLMDQLELQLGELVERRAQETAAEEIAAAQARASSKPAPRQRKAPARRPLPDHLPRERVVLPLPQTCPCFSIRPFDVKRELLPHAPSGSNGHSFVQPAAISSVHAYARIELTRGAAVKNGRFLPAAGGSFLRAASTAAYCRHRELDEPHALTFPSFDGTRGPVLLFGMSTLALPVWDQEDEAEQAAARPCRLLDGGNNTDNELTSSIVPRGTSSAQGRKPKFRSGAGWKPV
jgi:Transposase C of IS166 homeodomain